MTKCIELTTQQIESLAGVLEKRIFDHEFALENRKNSKAVKEMHQNEATVLKQILAQLAS